MPQLISFFLITITFLSPTVAQKTIPTSDTIDVSGELTESRIITTSMLAGYASEQIGDLVITNHMGEKKSIKKNVKGVRVKTLLEKLPFKIASPKELSAFYLTFIGSDGYAVVFSWNELFNNPIGNSVYFVTQMDDQNLLSMQDRILLAAISDSMTGRRFVKGVQKIAVGRYQNR